MAEQFNDLCSESNVKANKYGTLFVLSLFASSFMLGGGAVGIIALYSDRQAIH